MGSLNGKNDHDNDRDDRRRRGGPKSPRKRALPKMEALERRELLAIGDGFSAFVPDSNVLADVKRGPMAMAGEQLVTVYQEYQNFLAGGGGGVFQSRWASLLDIRGDKVNVSVSAGQGTVDTLRTALTNLGMQVTGTDSRRRMAEGLLPIAQLPMLVKVPQVVSVTPVSKAFTRQGSVPNQADRAMRTDVARTTFNVTGAGVKVGVLSDSVNQVGGGLASSISTGDLPGNVQVLVDGTAADSDEGRAMLELIYDMAPGASLAFHSANGGEIAFGNGIRALAQAGAQVIVDDIGYLSEPFFQDGIIATAVTDVVNSLNVSYFSSAGNSSDGGYQGPFRGANATIGGVAGRFMDFDPGAGVATTLPITVRGSGPIVLQWDNPFYVTNGVTSDLDLLLLDAGGAVVARTNTNNIAQGIPLDFLSSVPTATQIAVLVNAGSPDPGRIMFQDPFTDSLGVSQQFGTTGGVTYPTIYGHPAAAEAMGIGAVPFWVAPPFQNLPTVPAEVFSSHGPGTFVFNADGSRKAQVETRLQPVFSGTDASDTTFFIPGFDIDTTTPPPRTGPASPTNLDPGTFPNFFGTSASAPNVAAVAALMKQLAPGAKYTDIRAAMIASALPLNGTPKGTWDKQGGFGLVQADAALSAIDTLRVVTATPGAGQTLTTSPNSVVVTFSRPIDPTSLQASDLVFSQVPTGISLVVGTPVLLNATTASFPLTVISQPGVKANGTYSYNLRDGAVSSTDGRPLSAFNATFNLADVTNPWVTNTTILGRVVVVQFSEAMRGASVNAGTVVLERQIPGGWEPVNGRPGFVVFYDAPNNRAIVDLTRVDQQFLPSGTYRVTVSDTATDLVGNRLDGEFNGTFPSGDRKGLPAEDTDNDPFRQTFAVTLRAPQVNALSLEQTSGLASANPRVTGTLYSRRAVEIYFSQAMDAATINKQTVQLVLLGTGSRAVSLDPRATVTYDPIGNRAIIDISALDDASRAGDPNALPVATYAAVVLPTVRDRSGNLLDGEFNTGASATIPRNDGTTGRATLFPSGDGKPVGLENADNDQFTQVLPDLATSGPSRFVASDSGIGGDQNTNVTRPTFTGNIGSSFPAAAGGLTVAVQFNGPRRGTFDLDVGAGGRGFRGTPDLLVTTDANGNFRFRAPVDLPDGFNTVRIVVVGQSDLPPLPGLATRFDQSFRIDTTTPQATTSVAQNARLSTLTSLSIDIVDPILPTSRFDALAVPTQLSLPALDPTSASNISNYSLVNLGADNAPGGVGANADRDLSNFIVGATFVATTSRVQPGDPYTGRIDLNFASGLPSGRYVLTARRPQPGFSGITDAAGNPLDGDPSRPGAQDFTLTVDLQPQAAYIKAVQAISPLGDPDADPINYRDPSTFVASGPRSFFELSTPGTTARAEAPPVAFFVDFSNPLDPNRDYAAAVQLLRTANSGVAQPDGDFGLDNSFTSGVGYTRVTGLRVTLVNEVPGASFGQPGYQNRLLVELPAGTILPADSYRLFVPNVGATTIVDTFGNVLDGEFLGNPTSTGGFETLMPDGSYRPGLTGDGVGGGAFLTSYVVVPNGNIIYARPDYVDDPFLSQDDPDGSLAKPFPTLAPEAQANALNNGDLNSVVNFGTGFDNRLDRNQNGQFDRSALYAAQVASARGPVVVVALPGAQQRNPVTGVTTQETFVLAAPAGGTDPIRNNASATVPYNTTLSFAPGSTLKLQNASLFVQNQGSALQALGGFNPEDRVNFTSFSDDTIGGDSNGDGAPGSGGNAPSGGDWGGLVFRNYDQAGRTNLVPFPVDDRLKGPGGADARSGADDGMSLLNFSSVRYAGGPVPRTLGESNGPVTLFNSRPAVNNTRISDSRLVSGTIVSGTVGAITADFDSFREDELARGPLVRRVETINNSINGIFIRAELSGEARQTDAIAYPNNPSTKGGVRNFTIDDPLPHVLTTRLVVGQEELRTTGGQTRPVTNRLYVQPGMMFKMPRGTAIDAVTPGSSINIGDRTYVGQFDANNAVAPGDAGFRAPTVSDARVLFTSFYDDAATTVFRDPNTGVPTIIVPAIDTDGGGPANQPTSGNVPLPARWGGLGITSGARVVIDEAEFRFGGGIVNTPSGTIGQRDVIRFQGAGGRSLFGTTTGALGTAAYITNNDFYDNLQAAIGIDPNGLLAADPLRPLVSGNPFFRGNIMLGNDFNGMEVLPALQGAVGYVPNLTVDTVWDDTDLTYVLRGTIRPAGAEGGFFGGFPTANTSAFDVELRPALTLTIQSGLPDTVLADGSRIARPGESALVKLLNGAPLAGDGATGFTGPNNTYDSFGGAGFIFGVDDGVDPTADPLLDSGFYTQLRIVGIGGNETTGQQRVPAILTSLRDETVGRTVRGVVMNETIGGNNTAPAPGDGGVIAIGGNTLGDYNLYDPRDGNLIDNADIRYMTRIDLQGGGWVDVGTTGSAQAWKLGGTPETQLNSARAITISNSTLSDFSQVGVIAHPSGVQALQRLPQGGTPLRTLPNIPGFRGQPVLLYMVNNIIANMPVGVRLNAETVTNTEQQSPTEAVFLHNTFSNSPVAIRTQAPDFDGTNSLSHVHFLAMNNIFNGASTAAYQMVGQVRGSQGQFNVYSGGTPPQGFTYAGNFLQFDNVTDIPNAAVNFRDPANLDFTLGAGSDAVDRARSELGEVNLGLSLAPISDQILTAVGGIRNATGRTNPIGGIGGPGSVAGPGDIVTLGGFPGRTYRDQWIPALPGTPGAVPGPASVGGTFWFLPIGGERDRAGALRVDDPTIANLGVGSRPFFDIGASERRIIVPPRVVGVSAVFADPSSPTGVRTQDFYSVGGLAGSTQSPLAIWVRFDNRLDPATLNSRTVILQASGGDGIFGNNNNAADRTIDLSGKLSYTAGNQTLMISLAGISPALSNDQFRLTLFGDGSDVIRDPQGNALDGENTAGASPTGAQQALPSGNGIPGGNFFLSFSIDSNPPSVLPGSLRLAATSDTGRVGDNITSQGAPAFTGTIVDTFPPANVLVGQTVLLDYAGPDGVFGRLLADGTPDPADPAGRDDRLNVGSALTVANGVFTVTVGQDGANTGLVTAGATLPETQVNVGPDGWLGPNPATGVVDDLLSTYGLARVRVIDQSGNASNATDTKAQVRFVVDTRGPRITSASPAPGGLVTPSGGNFPVSLTTDENLNPATLNSSSIVVVRSGGDGVFGNGNDVALSVSAGSIFAQPIPNSPAGAMRVGFTVVGATTNDIYRVTLLGTGANSVADWAGNALDGEYGGGFPTGSGGPGGDFNLDVVVLSPSNVARVLFVDDDAPANPNATGGAGDPLRSIMGQTLPGTDGKIGTPDDVVLPGAMQRAGIGDTIAVLPGTYNEAVVLKSLVRLVSAGVGSTATALIPGQALQTVIRPPAPATPGTTIGVSATDVLSTSTFVTEVAGFTIMIPLVGNTANGPINTDSMGVHLANSEVLLRGNYVINAGTGVVISTNGRALPASPRLESNGIVGNLNGITIVGSGGTGFADDTPIQITNNTVAFNTTGMVIVAGPGYTTRPIADINNNIFAGNFEGTTTRTGGAIFNATQTIANLRANLFSNNGPSQASNSDDVGGASLGGAFNPRTLGTTPDAAGNFVGNPGFANPRDPRPSPQGQGPAVFFLDANFDLNSVSDAIDNANGALAPTKDFRSRGRVDIPNRGRAGFGPADIGAFERSGSGGIPGVGGSGTVLTSALASTRSVAGLTARALGTTVNTTTAGQTVTIRFSTAVDRASVQPNDLVLAGALDRLNPARASGLTWVDAQTVNFTLTGAFQPTGEVTVEIPEGAVRSAADGKPIQGYSAVLRSAPKATAPAAPAAPAAPTVVPPQAAAPTPGTNRPATRQPASAWARFLRLRRR
jgi:hypothetical protein